MSSDVTCIAVDSNLFMVISALASLEGEGQDEASPASSPPTVKLKPNDVQPKSKLAADAESQKK